LLFAHWPIPAATIQSKLPQDLRVDTLDGTAWLGVVPFVMDRVRFRTAGQSSIFIPTAHAFPELNLRTYVLGPDGRPGVYFFSLDAASLLAVIGARIGFGLPYFWASMRERVHGDIIHYRSRCLIGPTANFAANFRSLGTPAANDDLRQFLTERYALFVRRFGAVQIGEIHHRPWQLQNAEADIIENTLPQRFGFTLPDTPPILHYSHEIEMEAWPLRRTHLSKDSSRPIK
jgi:uncharacterized protein YqjF (DUF2071 family)